jgi:hypothetical protein
LKIESGEKIKTKTGESPGGFKPESFEEHRNPSGPVCGGFPVPRMGRASLRCQALPGAAKRCQVPPSDVLDASMGISI